MHMKIKHFRMLIAASAVLLGGLGCHTARKPATGLLPPSQIAPPPPAQQVKPTKPVVTQKTQPAPKDGPSAQTRNQPSSAAKPKPAAKPDPVAELIARVEKEYQAGLDQYNTGEKDGAKEHFDRAFNLLLESPSGIRADPRFQPEFDRVLDDVNKLEMAAVQQSEAAPEQKAEPAPIDEANEVTNYPV